MSICKLQRQQRVRHKYEILGLTVLGLRVRISSNLHERAPPPTPSISVAFPLSHQPLRRPMGRGSPRGSESPCTVIQGTLRIHIVIIRTSTTRRDDDDRWNGDRT